MRIKDRQNERHHEENPRQPGCELNEDIGRLRAEQVFGDSSAKGRAQTLALWPLHQDDQCHQKGN